MKKALLLLIIGLWTALSYGQDLKPCGTSVLTKRYAKTHGARTRQRAQSEPSPVSSFIGEKRGLIILVAFPDQDFSTDNPKEVWSAIANKEGYAENGAQGSVNDYFKDQSYGQFKLTFDVVGPVVAANKYAYYGENIDWGPPSGWFDKNVGELVEEACKGVAEEVQFKDYDWDGDGGVEEVYLVYAGHGENDYWHKDSTVIWPHMGTLSTDWPGYEQGITLQGIHIDTYACSNEISREKSLAGMGTICHEFSHCLGLPDLYNTEEGVSVLGAYDLMDSGNYNGNGWCPVGYSSYERYACGWLEPQVVEDAHSITALQPLHLEPDVRIFRTSPEASDYYLIESRQKASWDTYLPKGGLMAWHVDYDADAWADNIVNNDPNHLRVERMSLSKVPSDILSVSVVASNDGAWYDLQGRRLSAKPTQKGLYIHNGKKESIR